MEQHEQVTEAVIKRVGLTRRQRKRADTGLKRGAVAEIEPGKKRRVVAEKRDTRDERRD